MCPSNFLLLSSYKLWTYGHTLPVGKVKHFSVAVLTFDVYMFSFGTLHLITLRVSNLQDFFSVCTFFLFFIYHSMFLRCCFSLKKKNS
jgi:hypothetical protein